jgi:hypothetical protein
VETHINRCVCLHCCWSADLVPAVCPRCGWLPGVDVCRLQYIDQPSRNHAFCEGVTAAPLNLHPFFFLRLSQGLQLHNTSSRFSGAAQSAHDHTAGVGACHRMITEYLLQGVLHVLVSPDIVERTTLFKARHLQVLYSVSPARPTMYPVLPVSRFAQAASEYASNHSLDSGTCTYFKYTSPTACYSSVPTS